MADRYDFNSVWAGFMPRISSGDAPLNKNEGDPITLFNLLRCERRSAEDDLVEKSRAKEALEAMTAVERRFVIWHFWDDMTFAAIGLKIGLSRERVRQIVVNGLCAAAGRPRKFQPSGDASKYALRVAQIERACLFCGTLFQVGLGTTKKKYCGSKCADRYRSRAQKGANHGRPCEAGSAVAEAGTEGDLLQRSAGQGDHGAA